MGKVREALGAHLSTIGIEAHLGEKLESVQHVLTHIKMTVHPFKARLKTSPQDLEVASMWVSPRDLDTQPLSSVTRKVLSKALDSEIQGSFDF